MPLTDFDPVKRSDVFVRSRRRAVARPIEWAGRNIGFELDYSMLDPSRGNTPAAEEDLRQQMLAYAQRHDMQTGLLNYQSFQDSVAWLLNEGAEKQEIALGWIEVLNLRREFSLWGSAGTDALVRHIADALRAAAEPDAVLGRFSGRCFLVAMRGAKYDGRARKRIQSLINGIAPMRFCG